MSGVSGFGSDVRRRAGWRVPPENPHEEGFTFLSIGESMRSLRRTRSNMQEYMDRALRRLRDQTGEAYFIHSGVQGEGGAWPLINFGFKTLLSIDPA